MKKKVVLIPLCPEILGGLGIPRLKSTIKGRCVLNEKGRDVTGYFKKGAEEFLDFVKFINPDEIYLKEKSPSCGVNFTNVNWKKSKGSGVTAELLLKNGFEVTGVN